MTKKEIVKTLIKVNVAPAVRLGAEAGKEAEYLGNICGDLTSVIDALCDEIEETSNAR